LTNAKDIYYIYDDEGSELIGGYFRQMELFTWWIVPKSGHFVPTGYMIATQFMLRDFIEQKQLVCHHESGDCNLATT